MYYTHLKTLEIKISQFSTPGRETNRQLEGERWGEEEVYIAKIQTIKLEHHSRYACECFARMQGKRVDFDLPRSIYLLIYYKQ